MACGAFAFPFGLRLPVFAFESLYPLRIFYRGLPHSSSHWCHCGTMMCKKFFTSDFRQAVLTSANRRGLVYCHLEIWEKTSRVTSWKLLHWQARIVCHLLFPFFVAPHWSLDVSLRPSLFEEYEAPYDTCYSVFRYTSMKAFIRRDPGVSLATLQLYSMACGTANKLAYFTYTFESSPADIISILRSLARKNPRSSRTVCLRRLCCRTTSFRGKAPMAASDWAPSRQYETWSPFSTPISRWPYRQGFWDFSEIMTWVTFNLPSAHGDGTDGILVVGQAISLGPESSL